MKNGIDVNILRFEKSLKDKKLAIQTVNNLVHKKFQEKEMENLTIRDEDLRRWALEANRNSPNTIPNFRAGKKWLLNFKSARKIVSRKVNLRLYKYILSRNF